MNKRQKSKLWLGEMSKCVLTFSATKYSPYSMIVPLYLGQLVKFPAFSQQLHFRASTLNCLFVSSCQNIYHIMCLSFTFHVTIHFYHWFLRFIQSRQRSYWSFLHITLHTCAHVKHFVLFYGLCSSSSTWSKVKLTASYKQGPCFHHLVGLHALSSTFLVNCSMFLSKEDLDFQC